MTEQAEKSKGKFVADIREGSIHFGIMRAEGAKGVRFTAKLEHSYLKDGQFHPTDFYGEYELTDLARAALNAAKEIRKQRRAEEGATADGADEAEAA